MSVLDGACGCTLLHEGGEARIYRVRAGDRTLVLKWYADGVRIDPHSVEVLLHDRIAGAYRVVETGEREGRAYIVYEFIDGGKSDVFSPLPPAVALDSLRRVARTLAELSKRGVHHGDLSPSNVIFGRDGLPVVIDCGIVGPGAPAFAAPERFQGKPATEKSDLYSLGMLLYYWLAGEPLLSAADFDAYAAAANSADSLDPTTALFAKGVPAETLSRLEPLWKGLLRSSPEDRVEDFDELDELLEIAFDAECGGEVVWNSTRKAFVASVETKIGTNRSEGGENCELPAAFAVTKRTGRRCFVLPLAVAVLILFVMALVLLLSPAESSVDETGRQMLSKSRALDAGMPDVDSSKPVEAMPGAVLESLPVPVKNDGEE